MIKRYRVANHIFELEMAEGPLWDRLTNYSPFETDPAAEEATEAPAPDGASPAAPLSAPIFHVKVLHTPDGPEYPATKTPVLVGSYEKGAPKLDLYRCPDGWWVEMAPLDDMAPTAWLQISDDFSSAVLQEDTESDNGRFGVDNAMMLTFAFRTSTLHTLEMHSSVVVKDGLGFMFLGKSGTGKSTHSRMWLENLEGVRLLNDDNPIIRIENGLATVYGSPWSGKTPCYRNESAPIGAIVLIRRCKENRVTRMDIPEAYATILSSSSGFRAVEKMADGLHETMAGLITGVPCYVLDCLPDGDAARVCNRGVNPAAMDKEQKDGEA